MNQINDLFVDGIAKGRKMPPDQARALNDGRVHVGANAKTMGLVDQIGSFDDAMAGLRAAVARGKQSSPQRAPGMSPGAKQQEIAMSDTQQPAPVTKSDPAALKDLKAKFPKSTADWREKCQEDGLTLEQASERWTEYLAAENTRLQEELAQAKSKVPGTKPLATVKEREAGHDAGGSGDPKAALTAIAVEYQKAGMTREKAFSRACKENQELHQAWLASHTAAHGQTVKKGFQG